MQRLESERSLKSEEGLLFAFWPCLAFPCLRHQLSSYSLRLHSVGFLSETFRCLFQTTNRDPPFGMALFVVQKASMISRNVG